MDTSDKQKHRPRRQPRPLCLSESASGLILKTDEFMLLNKFAPYFDGVPVLDIDEESSDDSLLGAFKKVGQELKETFVSSKKIQATLISMNICVVIRKKSKNIFCPTLIVLSRVSIMRWLCRKHPLLQLLMFLRLSRRTPSAPTAIQISGKYKILS